LSNISRVQAVLFHRLDDASVDLKAYNSAMGEFQKSLPTDYYNTLDKMIQFDEAYDIQFDLLVKRITRVYNCYALESQDYEEYIQNGTVLFEKCMKF
jgi:hypothetical protein